MKIEDVDFEKQRRGEYCRKGSSGCFCAVGFPYELMCVDCRDNRAPGDDDSWCICPPKEEDKSVPVEKYRCKKCGRKGDTLVFQYTYRGYTVASNSVGGPRSIAPAPAGNILDWVPADVSEMGGPIGCLECRNWGEDGFELVKEES